MGTVGFRFEYFGFVFVYGFVAFFDDVYFSILKLFCEIFICYCLPIFGDEHMYFIMVIIRLYNYDGIPFIGFKH